MKFLNLFINFSNLIKAGLFAGEASWLHQTSPSDATLCIL